MRKLHDIDELIRLYENGMSSKEISELYEQRGITVSSRQIQRYVKQAGVSRNAKEAFNLAMQKGRVVFVRKSYKDRVRRTAIPPKTRFTIMERDQFRCVLCGISAKDGGKLEIDHIDYDPTNHVHENLRVLCYDCNIGRPNPNRQWYPNGKEQV